MKLNTTRFIFILRGILIGIVAGLVVSLFRLAIEFLLECVIRLFKLGHFDVKFLGLLAIIFLVIIVVVGKLIQAEPNIKGSGIPQIEGQLSGELEMNWWSVLWRKWIGGVLSISSGLSLGREGPSIQLGAAVGQGLAEVSKIKGSGRRVFIAGGASAGLSAAFNAPIASTLFILEEVYHNFSPLVWTTSLSAALAANYISLRFFGLTPVLNMKNNIQFPISQYFNLILLGIILGLFGLLYQYLTLNSKKFYKHFKFIPQRYWSIIPYVILMFVGYFLPNYIGGGNQIILNFSDYIPGVKFLIILLIVRLIFSVLSYGSGLPGGIFLPILSLGAIIGALYGVIAAKLGMLDSQFIVDCIIYAMAGYFACIGKAPFTAILLITEMVGSLQHLMPLAVVSLISYTVVDLLNGLPIYEALLEQLNKNPTRQGSNIAFTDKIRIPVFVGSLIQDRQVRQINWPKNSLLIEIERGEKHILPHGDTIIRSGDTLVVEADEKNQNIIVKEIKYLANGS